jgi:hypothetical protein
MTDEEAEIERLQEQIQVLREALNAFLDRHIALVNSGDCGCWNPEDDSEVQQARKALAATEPSK